MLIDFASQGKRTKRRKESYAIYIYKVLKQVHSLNGVLIEGVTIGNLIISGHRFTLTLEFHPKLWQSWIVLWTTSLRESQENLLAWLTTTNAQQLQAGKFKLPSDFYFPVNLPSTPSQKAPRLSPSTQVPNESDIRNSYRWNFPCFFIRLYFF